jgi:SAM-dependent methyltransferase
MYNGIILGHMNIYRKKHWDNIYQKSKPEELSWYEDNPETSLMLIAGTGLPLNAEIFDNGGGASRLVDNLIDLGYKNINVRDISESALNITKKRLGNKAEQVSWIVDDEASCCLHKQFDIWHDRAAFHFLTDNTEINNYTESVKKCIKPGGYFIISTFSENGPSKCSGLEVKKYSEDTLYDLFMNFFEKIICFTKDHRTPGGKIQNFLTCVLRRK